MIRKIRSLIIPGVDKDLLVKDATKLMPDLSRRRFIAVGCKLRRVDAAHRLRCRATVSRPKTC